MATGKIKNTIKRELVRAMYERMQSVDMEKFGAPKAEDAVDFENVEEILNIAYMNRDEVPLGMDIFKPIVPEGTELPVVVTIHGGGLTLGDRKISRPFGRILAHKGYLVFSIEYRLAPRANVCMQLDDVCAGLDLVGQKLVDYDVDFNRIFIAAESAGAYLAAYVTAMKGSKKLQEAIGYEPTRVSFKAIGLMSGMLYTNKNKLLADQIFGEKRADEEFLQYMDPENPEIINNLPPAFLVTSKADMLSSYSFLMTEALKRAGKPCRFLYYGDDELQHAFSTLQTEHPKALDSIDKMLAWFEEQAKISANREKSARTMASKKQKMLEAMKDGSFDDQKIWKYVKERASVDPGRLYAPAIIDCSRTYTYGQMFDQWDNYARVFTALNMTGSKGARVAIVGSISAEPLFAYYGLNMVGTTVSMFSYPDLMPGGRWKTMVEKEHITDMIISDIMVTPQMWEELKKAKEEFGLNNILLLHTRMGGPCTGYAEMLYDEFNYHALKRIPDVQYMDELLVKYKDGPIRYPRKGGDQIAVICHTSGTSNGTRKPLPYTDRIVNSMASAAPSGFPTGVLSGMTAGGHSVGVADGAPAGGPPADFGRMTLILPFDFSASSSINGFVNMVFASGHSIVTTLFGFLHPKFVRAFKHYKVDLVFSSGFLVDKWMDIPDLDKDAFSHLKVIGFGGSYLAPTKLDKYQDFLKAHGFKGLVFQGYGMSELAGGLFIVPPDCEEDIIGFPDDMENFRIYDETDGKFHRISEGERDGVIYGRSDSMCLNVLDGETLFELTNIDDRDYICMNDVVHVNANGSLSYVGRSNQFFANNDGVKFESSIIETQLSAHPNIDLCAIVPVLDKRIHDTVPVLYVVPANKNRNAAEQIRRAIVDVFTGNEKLKTSILPTQFIVVDSIPFNSNGKIDVYHITRSRLTGTAYNITPIRKGEELSDIRYERTAQLNSYTGGALPEGMGKDSAFGTFDMFSETPKIINLAKIQKARAKNRAAEIKGKKEELKSKLPEIKLSMPEMDMGTFSMSKLPRTIANAASLAMILMQDQEISDRDIDE